MKTKPDVIIVDDDPLMNELIEGFLEQSDLVVATCIDPRMALEMIVEHKPKIVFIDLNMPHIRGDKLMVKLSEKYIFQTTSLFLITGEVLDEMTKKQLMTLGFDHIIHKPFTAKEIFQAITSVIGVIPVKQKAA